MADISIGQILKMTMKSLFKRRSLRLAKPLESVGDKKSPLYIVSLTSYGKRLKTNAPYAAASLLNQSVKPDKIILWVGHDDKNNVPKIMERLIDKGLEIRYCENLRSYKKLVPAIENFSDDFIVTADDDVFYPRNWFEQIIETHKRHPKKIICHRAHGIKVDANRELLPYTQWDLCLKKSARSQDARRSITGLFPTGCGGVLYPPKCFYRDVTNKNLFTKLAPHADDIWFWAMAVINTTYFGDDAPYAVIENSCMRDLVYVDLLGQIFGGTLMRYNKSQGGNDIQLKAVIERYPQIRDIALGKICPS